MAHIDKNFEERLERMEFDEHRDLLVSDDGRYISELGPGGNNIHLPVVLNQVVLGNITSWEEFILALRTEAGDTNTDILTGFIFQNFRAEYMVFQGLEENVPDVPSDIKEFELLLGPSPTQDDKRDLMNALFVRAFDHFIENVDFDGTSVTFHDAWRNFLSLTNPIDDDITAFGDFSEKLTSYSDIYFAFFKDGSQTEFETRFKDFVEKVTRREGYFSLNHFVGEWYLSGVRQLALAFGKTAVEETGSEKLTIIFDLFRLLTDMLGVLQKVAATQAERLRFYANMQKAYTELMNRVPNVTIDQIVKLSGDPDENRFKKRDDDKNLEHANMAISGISATTQSYTERMRAFRSVWSDEARSHQTSVNQSNETVNQQSNLATALLQQVSTILQGIFK